MNGKSINPLLAILALSLAARGVGGDPLNPKGEAQLDLDELLGGRQKGKRIDPLAEFLFQSEVRPFSEAPEELKEKVRADILAGKVQITPGCDCEFCSWVTQQPQWAAANNAAPDPGERFRQEYGEGVAARQDTVPGILREAAATYEQRNPLYGDAYKHYGSAMMAFFPQGLYINEPEDWNRFGLFSMMVSKMNRIANNITTGGHRDSSLDLSVYAAMMTELTEEK